MCKIIRFKLSIWATVILLVSAMSVKAGEITPQLQSVLDSTGTKEKVAVIIELKTQVDRIQFRKFTKKLRRVKLIQQLKQQADANDSALRSYLQNNDAQDMRRLWIINSLAVKAKPAVIKKIADRPEVQEIRLDVPVPLVNDTGSAISIASWNIAMLDADQVWAQGFEGQGVVVASMDSGVDYNHAALAGNWRGGTNSWFDPHGQHTEPFDKFGHGTQTMGIMVGQSVGQISMGMAPKAKWIAVKIFNDTGVALYSDIHAGFQWLLDPDGNPNTDDAPDIVNNSWGYPDTINTCQTEFQADIQILRDLDINVVFAAGNQGGAASSISPANNTGAFAVGAVEQSGIITTTSSQGPSACLQGGIYPGAVAPGYLVSTADLTSGGLFPTVTTLVSGTSFAAPHVSGAMALLLSSNPDLTPDDLELAIEQSSTDLGDPGGDNVYGYGLVNVASALAFLAPGSLCTDADGDGYFAESNCGTPIDCDDTRPGVYPGVTGICVPTVLNASGTPVSVKAGKVILTWTDVVGEIQYRVEWSADNFATVYGRVVAADATTFTTPDIVGGAYQFRVGAQNVSGWVRSPPVDVTIPTTVASIILSATTTPVSAKAGKVTLTWRDVVGEIRYRVEWSDDKFGTVAGRVVEADATTFTTPGILGGDYQFRVGVQYPNGWFKSIPVQVTIPTTVAPTILNATAMPAVNATVENVIITWNDLVSEIQYRVEWSDDNFVTVAGRVVAADATTFTSPGIVRQDWKFRIGAQYPNGWFWSVPVDVAAPLY